MNHKKIILTLIILLSISFQSFYPNVSDAVFDKLKKNIELYFIKSATEKVYLHTDKDVYQLGDTLWFKAYFTKFNHVRSLSSNVLILSLFNDKNEEIVKEYFKVSYGTSSGDLIIPKYLDDGDYKLVAYSNNMQNVDSTNLYSKIVKVYENRPPFQIVIKNYSGYYNLGDSIDVQLLVLTKDNQALENIPVKISLVSGKKKYSKIESISTKGGNVKVRMQIPDKELKNQLYVEATSNYLNYNVRSKIKIPVKGTTYQVRFFPEGGELIEEVKNRVAFEVYDDYNNLINIQGLLKDSLGNILDSIKTSYTGIGNFTFTPKRNQKYYIDILQPYKSKESVVLPQAKSSGISLRVDYQEMKTISIDLNVSEDLRSQDVFGVLYSGDKTYWTGRINLRSQNQVMILISKLPEGISQFTVFTNNYIPIAERLLYIPTEKRLKIQIKANKKTYRPKEKVSLDILVTDAKGDPVSANLSLAVVDGSAIIPDNYNHIVTYNLFDGELGENLPDQYLMNGQNVEKDYVDLILMTKGWRRFKWDKIINSDNVESVYEKNKKFIKGTITNYRGKSVKNANIQLFNPYQLKVISKKSDENGEFYFTAKDYISIVDTGILVIAASRKGGESNVNIALNSNYYSLIDNYLESVPVNKSFLNLYKYESIINSTEEQDYYKDFDAQTTLIEEVRVIGKRRVKIEEATRRKVYHEIVMKGKDIGHVSSPAMGGMGFIEVIIKMTTNIRVDNGKIMFRGYNSLINHSGALIVIDGMPMGEDISILDNLNYNDIESVKIVKNPAAALRYQGGSLGGLIEITLKKGYDFVPGEYKSIYKNKVDYKGYRFSREFYSPIYKNNEDKLATYDIRNTLYWNQNLRIDKTGKRKIYFYNSDQKMRVKVIAEGMNFDQMAGHGETEFVVY